MAEPKKKKSSTAKTRVITSTAASGSKKPKASVKTTVKSVDSKAADKVEKKNAKKTSKTTAKAAAISTPAKQPKDKKSTKKEKKEKKPSYLKGAWYELRQVRWPDRSNTWQMTVAVIIFSLILAGIVLLLDLLFQYLFNRIILQG